MGRDMDRRRIQNLENMVKRMAADRIKMIQAFQNAFQAMGGRVHAITQAITVLGESNPEVLKLLQVQSEEGTDEADSGDGQSRILPMSGARADSRTPTDAELSEDSASGETAESSGGGK